jgi:glycine/D-amino acid oxidase-like deaminating enzyme
METKTYETIIIGAGISGLACANHLQKHGKDFLLISKDIGGRMRTSEDGTANYGAFFVCSDYENVLPFVTLQKRIRLRDFCFHENETAYPFYGPRLLLYLHQFMTIKQHLNQFRNALRTFRKTAENTSQRKAIEADPLLHSLYMKDADEFVKENRLEPGTDKYLSKALYSTTFSPVSDMNAFSFLQFLLPLITPIYTFHFEKRKMTSSFQDSILIDSATDINRTHDHYKIKTNTDTFLAKNLVIATEISWSSKFAGIKEMNTPVSTHMIHIRGTPRSMIARKKYQLFCHPSIVQSIADLGDGTYLFYYKDTQPPLENYFHNPQVITHHFWDPAGRIHGHVLIESNRGKNMYLIGDYNIAGLEETYITGIYAANHIITSA